MPSLLSETLSTSHSDAAAAGDNRRAVNTASVLRTILDRGPIARSTVARLTGLSAAAVGRQYADLAALGLVREMAPRAPRAAIGRPHIPVDIDTGRHAVCGVHIAQRHATLTVMDLRGRVLATDVLAHDDTTPVTVLARVASRMGEFLRRHGGGRVPLGLGLATGGWVDPGTGVVVRHEQLGWNDVPAADLLAGQLAMPVRVESHTRALARAEQLFGRVRTQARSSMVHLFVGNVVDAAIVTAGTVHRGPRSAAGDIAHLPLDDDSVACPCGRRGCFQATVCDLAMGRRAATSGVIDVPSFAVLMETAAAGDPRAVELLRWRARMIGRAAGMLLGVINPEVLVVVEAALVLHPELAPGLLDELRAGIVDRTHARGGEPTIVASSFAADVLAVAAGSIVLDEVYARPLELRRGTDAT